MPKANVDDMPAILVHNRPKITVIYNENITEMKNVNAVAIYVCAESLQQHGAPIMASIIQLLMGMTDEQYADGLARLDEVGLLDDDAT